MSLTVTITNFSSTSIELFKEYVVSKDDPKAPKKFTDCAKLFSECRAPNEHSVGVKKMFAKKKNQTVIVTPAEAEVTTEIDPVTKYVKKGKV